MLSDELEAISKWLDRCVFGEWRDVTKKEASGLADQLCSLAMQVRRLEAAVVPPETRHQALPADVIDFAAWRRRRALLALGLQGGGDAA